MSRYFFDLHDGQAFTRDPDGLLCESLKELSFKAVDVLSIGPQLGPWIGSQKGL
ncbi:DUF6894 family protein [Mesorhizobium sophorae]|uniref:DUF6894 family protein n=1 Tax=Mesorhizobium sophorae TaxID=1300294 RepID=UPI003CC93E90